MNTVFGNMKFGIIINAKFVFLFSVLKENMVFLVLACKIGSPNLIVLVIYCFIIANIQLD